MGRRAERYKPNKLVKAVIACVFWIGIWFIAAEAVGKELLIPMPLTVLKRLAGLVKTGDFWIKTGISLLRIIGGFVTGLVAGTVLAVLAAVSEYADAVITPFIRIIRSTPVTSFILLVMLWISYSFVPLFIASLLVTPIVYMNLREGISETDKSLLEVAQVFKFTKVKTLRLVYIPSIRPYFVSAAVTSLGLAWKAGIAAEVICLPSASVGREIYYSKLYLETPDLFAWTLVVILFSFVFEKLFEILVKNKKKEAAKNDENRESAGLV